MWTAAILGGGQARRLGGRDKGALLVGGRTILERQLAVLHELGAPVIAVGGDPGRPALRGVTVVPDRLPGHGALGGLYTALVASPTDHVVVLAYDMPFVTAAFLGYLAALPDAADAIVPRTADGRHPLCARYHRRAATLIRSRLEAGQLRIEHALSGLTVRELGPEELKPFDPDGRLLFNVNTAEDYQRACALAGDAAESKPPLG